jgi:RimJ/RimL family protein N-acetyltransferase
VTGRGTRPEATTPNVLETQRLMLRRLDLADAEFILELVNDPEWLRFIGDKGVHDHDDARNYLRKGPMAMYESHGFGLYLTALKDTQIPIGMCGLIKRDTLEDVDIGFAFLPTFRAQGYALEAAAAVLAHGRQAFALKRIVAITSQENARSGRLLEKLGLKFTKTVKLANDDEELNLYAVEFRGVADIAASTITDQANK